MKLNKLTIPLAGLLRFRTSCGSDFLNQVPDNEYVEDNFYASDEAVASSTAPLYNRAWFDYNQRSIVPMGSLRANDNHYAGKELRLKQQYFFISASVQTMVQKYLSNPKHTDIRNLHEKIVFQLNDTHPTVAIQKRQM